MRPTLRLLLVICALAACAAGPASAGDGAPPRLDIVGGGDVPDPNPYVYQVSIGEAGVAPADGKFCGGSLIAPTWVLTAAHCLNDTTAEAIQIVAGVRVLSEAAEENIYAVSRILLNEGYDPAGRSQRGEENTQLDDIALVELARPVAEAGWLIPLISAEQEPTFASPGTLATLSGWGGLKGYPAGQNPPADQTYPDIMQTVDLPLVSDEVCGAAYALDANKQLCAGYLEGGKDGCQGDSGGPLTVPDGAGGYLQVGVVSFGSGCAAPDFPGVYVRVSAYADWIQAAVNPPEFTEQLYLPDLAR